MDVTEPINNNDIESKQNNQMRKEVWECLQGSYLVIPKSNEEEEEDEEKYKTIRFNTK